jgi:hypothetical protein
MSDLECMMGYVAHQMSVQIHHKTINERIFKRAVFLSERVDIDWRFINSVAQIPSADGCDTWVTIHFFDKSSYAFKTKEPILL